MPELTVDSIIVGTRFRKDMGDIAAFAARIEKLGVLLQPIVVDMNHCLIAGARRLEAVKQLGWTTIPVHIVDMEHLVLGEFAENEDRKPFTTSERVAIGEEVERILGNRQGQRTDLAAESDELPQNFAEVPKGQETRKAAAKAAGFKNAETYRQAKAVVKNAAPVVVEAMDKDEVTVNAAFKLSKLSAEEQTAAVEVTTTPSAYSDLAPELAEKAAQIKLSKAAAVRLATLPAKQQIALAKKNFGRAIQGKANALLKQEQKAKAKQKEQKAREEQEAARAANVRQETEQRIIDVIVPALVAAGFDRETQERVYDVAYGWNYDLGNALFDAFDLPCDDEEAAQEAHEAQQPQQQPAQEPALTDAAKRRMSAYERQGVTPALAKLLVEVGGITEEHAALFGALPEDDQDNLAKETDKLIFDRAKRLEKDREKREAAE